MPIHVWRHQLNHFHLRSSLQSHVSRHAAESALAVHVCDTSLMPISTTEILVVLNMAPQGDAVVHHSDLDETQAIGSSVLKPKELHAALCTSHTTPEHMFSQASIQRWSNALANTTPT